MNKPWGYADTDYGIKTFRPTDKFKDVFEFVQALKSACESARTQSTSEGL